MTTPASVLSVYGGRTCLGHIDVSYVAGKAEFRARLPNGRRLGTYAKQADARAAIEAADVAAHADDNADG